MDRAAVPHRLPARDGPRPDRQEDVEDDRQRRRSARGRSTQIGADALRFTLINGTSPGNDQKPLAGQDRHRPELRQQALERGPVRPRGAAGDDRRRTRLARAPDVDPAGPGRALDPEPDGGDGRRRRSGLRDHAYGEATRLLYDAVWSELCDWGLELAKVRLADAALPPEVREATWWTLVEALDVDLRLLHPFLPFVTEAIWTATPARSRRSGPADRGRLAGSRGGRLDTTRPPRTRSTA